MGQSNTTLENDSTNMKESLIMSKTKRRSSTQTEASLPNNHVLETSSEYNTQSIQGFIKHRKDGIALINVLRTRVYWTTMEKIRQSVNEDSATEFVNIHFFANDHVRIPKKDIIKCTYIHRPRIYQLTLASFYTTETSRKTSRKPSDIYHLSPIALNDIRKQTKQQNTKQRQVST